MLYSQILKSIQHIGDFSIPLDDQLTLLGVTLDSNLNFEAHVSKIVKKAKQSIYLLKRIRKFLNYEEAKLIYTSVIGTRLKYCATILTFATKNIQSRLESCQNKPIRVICRAPKIFFVTDGRLSLSLHTLAYHQHLSFRNLVCKVASLEPHTSAIQDIIFLTKIYC